MKTILHVIKKEFLQFKRDPRMFAIVLIAPVVQLILLGYAATLDIKSVYTIVYDQDKSISSRNFISEFESSGFFNISVYVGSYKELTRFMDDGKIILAIVIPYDFSKNIQRKSPAAVQAIFNGSDGNSASIAAGYTLKILQKYSEKITAEYLQVSGRKILPAANINPEVRIWYNPYLLTRWFMIPGIVGLLLSIITLLLTSLAVVKEKEIGTLEQLIVTPLKSYQLIIGKLIPFVIVGFTAVIIVLAAMTIFFGIPIRGSVAFLFFCSLIYILSTLGLGLFVSTISKTQQQAMMIAIFAVLMPMVFLSGFAFPLENMPAAIQWISYTVPLRYFITIIRGIILKGIGFQELWSEALILFIMGAAILLLSSLRFRKKLE